MTWTWFDSYMEVENARLRKENKELREACLWALSTLTDRDDEDLNETDKEVIALLRKFDTVPAVNNNQRR